MPYRTPLKSFNRLVAALSGQPQAVQIDEMNANLTDQDRFTSILSNTLNEEGGLVNDPRGGVTNFGISSKTHPGVDVRGLTRDKAGQLYRKNYWEGPGFSDLQDYNLARKVFDVGVTAGPQRATRILQQALNLLGHELKVDSILGPKTLQAANEFYDPEILLHAFRDQAGRYYKSLKDPRYESQWLARLAR